MTQSLAATHKLFSQKPNGEPVDDAFFSFASTGEAFGGDVVPYAILCESFSCYRYQNMRFVRAVPLVLALLATLAVVSQKTSKAAESKTETIVLIRHGETSLLGLGQITCKGLNRALALPGVLISKFGKPDEIYAPDPTGKSHDLGGTFDYVRPLATIEPTAIRLGMPVNCDYRFDHIKDLENELLAPQNSGKLIFIAWEHKYLNQMVKDLLRLRGSAPNQVPDWPWYEYDRIYILRIPPGSDPITFAQDQENLNNLSDDCPGLRNQ